MLTSSHWAVGLAFAGSIMILTGMIQGFYSARSELKDGERRRKLRQAVMEVWRNDPRATMTFNGTADERQEAEKAYNEAWAGYRKIGEAGGAKLATFGDVSNDPFGEEGQLEQLRQQIKALKKDLIWIGTGTILTAVAGLLTITP